MVLFYWSSQFLMFSEVQEVVLNTCCDVFGIMILSCYLWLLGVVVMVAMVEEEVAVIGGETITVTVVDLTGTMGAVNAQDLTKP